MMAHRLGRGRQGRQQDLRRAAEQWRLARLARPRTSARARRAPGGRLAQHGGLAVTTTQPVHATAHGVIKLTASQYQPGEPRPARGLFLWRALRRGARAIQDFNAEQVRYWERFHQASRALVPGDGQLAWVRTLDGYRLAGRHLPARPKQAL